jgi:hypothetical protein
LFFQGFALGEQEQSNPNRFHITIPQPRLQHIARRNFRGCRHNFSVFERNAESPAEYIVRVKGRANQRRLLQVVVVLAKEGARQ